MGYRNEVLKKKALVLSWGPVWKAASKAETGWPFRSFLELRWPTLHAAFSLFSFFFFASTLQEQMVIGLVSWSSYKYYYIVKYIFDFKGSDQKGSLDSLDYVSHFIHY